jgi:NTP pyrophosphatase (non-canonical NTP hydrolase)
MNRFELKIKGKYNFINQSERLIYLGADFQGRGRWNQFAKVEEPLVIWSELLDSDLHMIEETVDEPAAEKCDSDHTNEIAGFGVSGPQGIKQLCQRQFDWVERMGWHNKTVLEALALIASEVGEAVNECRGDQPTENFKVELADICLRVFDLAHSQNIDLLAEILAKMKINDSRGTRGRRI